MKKVFIISLFFIAMLSSFSIAKSSWFVNFLGNSPNKILIEDDPVADFEFTPDDVCANQAIQFTNKSTGTRLTYLWNFGDGVTSTQQNPSHTFLSATGGGTRTFNVSLTVKDEEENDSTITKEVTIKEIPSLLVSSDQGQTTFDGLQYYIICENESSDFTFYNGAGSTENNTQYEIDWGDGSTPFTGATWNTLNHTYSVGIYRITYTVTPANGCKVSRQYGVFIGSNPAVGLGNPGNTNVCVGDELTFPISGTENNPDGTVYTVTFSDGSTPQEFAHPPPASVSHIFTNTSCGTDSDGFQNSFSVKIVATNPCAVSQASVVPIYVSEPPVPVIQVPRDIVCVDQNITIRNLTNFKVEVGNNGVCAETKRFVWEIEPASGWTLQGGTSLGSRPNPNSPNSWVSGTENLTPKFTEPGTYTIKLITGNRCGIKEEIETICVIPIPDPTFDLSTEELCESGEVKVTSTSNILGTCGEEDGVFAWSVSYNRGNCGTVANRKFINGTNTSSVNPEFEFLSPGEYNIQLTLRTSCGSFTESRKVIVSAPPIVTIQDVPNSCGASFISPTATFRTCDDSTPTFLWTFEGGIPATSSEKVPGIVEFNTPGEKKIILEVTTACGSTVTEKTFTIFQPPMLDLGDDQEICNGEEIQLNASVTGGSGKYSIRWISNPISPITSSTILNPLVKPNVTTIYTAIITDNDTGCQDTDQVQVTVTPAPTISFDRPNQIICSGEESLPISITSNPAGENIIWKAKDNGVLGVTETGTTNIPSQTLINQGNTPIDVEYTAEIIGASQGDCAVVPAVYIIRVNPAPTYQNEEKEICSGDNISFRPIGYVEGTTFTWEVNAPSEIQGASSNAIATTNINQQLINNSEEPIDVTYSITPKLGICLGESFELTVKVLPPLSIDFSQSDQQTCRGGEIQLNASITGGSGDYTIQWTSNPTSTITDATSVSTSAKPNVTTIYTATVTDIETGCKKTDQIEVSVLPAPTFSFDQPNQEICSGESTLPVAITSNPSGENITWTSQANGVLGVLESGTTNIPIQTLINLGDKPIDVIYTAEINSASIGNCPVVPSVYIVTVNPLPTYQNEEKEICSGDNISFRPIGYVQGTTFTWEVNAPSEIQGASSNVIATTTINQQLTNSSNELLEVAYTITPKLGDCLGESFELIVKVSPSPSIIFSLPDQELCTGSASSAVTLNSNVLGTTFSWTASPTVQGLVASGTESEIPSMNLVNTTNLPIDIRFEVLVNTSLGGSCSGTPRIYTITVNPEIQVQSSISDFNGYEISCFGANDGNIALSVSGGSGNYEFNWTGPNGFSASTESIDNLSPGNYSVVIKDEFGCIINRSYVLEEPNPLIATLESKKDVLCVGEESGEIVLNVSGGVESSGYSILWKRDGIDFSNSGATISQIPAGVYQATVRDVNGCTFIIQEITITEPEEALIINFTKTDISCFGANDGSLSLNVSGGLAPYNIQWTFGSSQSSFDNLGPGNYTLTVSDQGGCIRSQTITIEDAPLFKIEADVRQISCFGQKDGFIKLNFQGGVGAYTIRWDDGSELGERFNLSSGTYGVRINDETDCEIRSEFNIVEPSLLEIEPQVTDALDCDNTSSGEIRLGIKGGTAPYSIKWSNGSTDEILSGVTSGQYAVEVIDSRGCSINQVFEIKRPARLVLTLFQSTNIQCEPRSITDEIRVNVSGGIAPYTILWSGGDVSGDQRTMTTDQPGFYQVTVVDGNGCSTTQSFEVDDKEIIPNADIESVMFDQYNSYLVNFEIQFWNRSFGEIVAYHWDFGDGTQSFEENPVHKYSAEGDYEITLTVTDIFGCSISITKKISVFDYYLVTPNAFTPNGDGVNDYFFPRFINIASLEFWVLNKWGETVFYTDDLESLGWDGKVNNAIGTPGNYVYKLKFKTLDGRTQTETNLFLLLR